VPDIVNPVPLGVAELMVSGAVPEEVNVTDCGAEVVLRVTLPKLRLDVLSCNPGPNAPRLISKVLVAPPAEAVSVAVCAIVTSATVAVNWTVVAPAETVTDAGMVTASSLLERVTASPLLPAA